MSRVGCSGCNLQVLSSSICSELVRAQQIRNHSICTSTDLMPQVMGSDYYLHVTSVGLR